MRMYFFYLQFSIKPFLLFHRWSDENVFITYILITTDTIGVKLNPFQPFIYKKKKPNYFYLFIYFVFILYKINKRIFFFIVVTDLFSPKKTDVFFFFVFDWSKINFEEKFSRTFSCFLLKIYIRFFFRLYLYNQTHFHFQI